MYCLDIWPLKLCHGIKHQQIKKKKKQTQTPELYAIFHSILRCLQKITNCRCVHERQRPCDELGVVIKLNVLKGILAETVYRTANHSAWPMVSRHNVQCMILVLFLCGWLCVGMKPLEIPLRYCLFWSLKSSEIQKRFGEKEIQTNAVMAIPGLILFLDLIHANPQQPPPPPLNTHTQRTHWSPEWAPWRGLVGRRTHASSRILHNYHGCVESWGKHHLCVVYG